MSSNKLMYDQCAYEARLGESAGTLEYMLDSSMHENVNKCRVDLGIVGGSNVSEIKGNLVDLESDLFGVTRKATLCPSKQFKSKCSVTDINNCQPNDIVIDGPGCNVPRVIDTSMVHLPSCNMFRYKPVPLPPPMELPSCPGPQVSRCQWSPEK